MNEFFVTNKVNISGLVVKEPVYSHKLAGKNFYTFEVEIKRKSGTSDLLPVIFSEKVIDAREVVCGKAVSILGQYRSHNEHSEGKTHLRLYVFANIIEVDEYLINDVNEIFMEGIVCKTPMYRITPRGRELTEVLIGVNRPNGVADYIPCIYWGRTASYVSRLSVGTVINMTGRIQSREYTKVMPDGTEIVKTAYEVSVKTVEVI